MTKKSKPATKMQRTAQPRLLLEQRIVFDAAMAATGADLVDKNSNAAEHTPPAVAHDTPVEAAKNVSTPAKPPVEAAKDVSAPVKSSDAVDDHRGEADTSVVGKAEPVVITFIDSSVENIQAAIVGYPGEVIVLKAGQDGIDQIAAALAGRTNVSAIHIISHGSAGELELGTGILNSFTMAGRYAADMEAIKNALTEDGDILIYGCDVAADNKGAMFMAQMARVTGADIEGSTDGTGAAERGGNWTLESRTGTIEAQALRDDAFSGLLTVAANNGDGALLAVSGNIIYSVDIATGKGFAITTVPANVGGVAVSAAINSLAVDQANGLIYYTDGAASATNLALFAYDYINNTHILIDANMTDNGAGKSIFGGQRGVGSGSATFANGVLYFGVEQNKTGTTNNANGTNSTIYAITLTGGGRVINTVTDLLTITGGDWGDIGYDFANNNLLSVATVNGTANTFTRYNPTTGAVVSATTASAGASGSQLGETNTNKTYFVGTTIQQFNPNTNNGALIGTALTITNGNGTNIAAASDAAGWTPPTGIIGDKIFFDNNNNGTFDSGVDVGAAGVTVQLIKDVNNNGTVDAADLVLATDTTDANGDYAFTNILPGNYIVRVTDTGNVLGVSASHPYTQTGTSATRGDADMTTIGGSVLTIDFGVKNSAPVAVNDTATTLEDNAITFDPRTNDTDADGDALSIRQVNGTAITAGGAGVAVAGGVVTLNAAGTLTFTPTANFNGSSTFSYQLADRTGTTTTGNITVTVTPVNDAPSGTSATLTAVEDTARTFTSADFGFTDANDSPANTLQSVVITTLPGNGTIRLNGTAITAGQEFTVAQLAQLTFTAAANANGNAYTTFTFQVRDNGGTTNGGVNLDPTPKTITFNVTAVNDAPTQVVPATYSTNEDTSVKITGISIADVDANGGVETITLTVAGGTLVAAANGGVTVTGSGTSSIVLTGTIANLNTYLSATATQPTFNPVANFNGTVQLTVTTDDAGNTGIDPGTSGTATSEAVTSTSTITVVSVNDAPQGADATLTAIEDTARVFTAADFGFTDTADSPANALASVVITTLPTNGTIRFNGTAITAGQEFTVAQLAQLTFTAAANANGNAYAAFTFQVRDNGGTANGGVDLDQTPNTITFNVTPVNDAPQGTDATLTAIEDTARVFTAADFGFTDTADTPANALQSVVITTLPANGTIRFNGTAITAGQEFTVAQLAQLTFTAAANANGNAYTAFTFQVRDDGGTANGGVNLDQSPNTITFNVTPVNDAPQGADATITALEDTARVFTAADFGFTDTADSPANALASVIITTLPTNGTIRLNGTAITAGQEFTVAQLAQLTFTAAANANGNAYSTFTFQVRDNGGTANGGVDLDQSPNTITVNVTSVNDAPAGTDATLTAVEDTARVFTAADFGFSDTSDSPANALASVIITTLPTNGTIRLNGVAVTAGQEITVAQLPQLTFTAAANANGNAYTSFTFQVRDDGGTANGGVNLDQSPNTITFNVTPVNDAPQGADSTLTAIEDTARVFTAADFGFTDTADSPANALASVIITTLPANGTIRLNGVAVTAGQEIAVAQFPQLTFTAAANANGNAYTAFTFQVRDDGGTASGGINLDQSPNTITFNVTSVNDAPQGADATITAVEDTARVFTAADFGFTDTNDTPANTLQSVVITSLPANGTIRLNGVAITAGQEFTVAQLAQLTFTAAPNANGNAYSTFTFQVRDNGGTANGGVDLDQSPNTITVNVTPVNDAPQGADATLTAIEDTARVFTAADFGFSDTADSPANALASVIITTLPANGTIRLNGVAVTAGQEITVAQLPQLTFTAAANANGNAYASFTFQVRDDGGTANGGVNLDQSPNTITFNVTPVNDAPQGADATLTAVEDTARVFTAADFGFTDTADTPANALASVVITTLPANGTIRFNGTAIAAGQEFTVAQLAQLTFTAATNANGNAYTNFTFQVRDNGGTANGGVNLDQTPNTITFNVTSVNDAPQGADATLTAVEDTARVFTAADFGFTDTSDTPANALASVIITTLPANGTIRFNGTAITAGQEFTVAQLAQLTFTAAPNGNGNGYTNFTFQVRDNGGTANGGVDLDQTPNTITFNVTSVNDAPQGADATLTAVEDTARVFTAVDFGFTDTADSPANALASVIITTLPANGTIRFNGTAITAGQEFTVAQLAQLTFTAASNANGNAYTNFTFQVRDNGGTANGGVDLDQTPNTITFNVTPVNDAPQGTDATITAVEDTARVFTAADFGFTDTNDTPANALQSVVITTLPGNGTIRLNGVAITAGQEFTVAQLAQLTFTAAPNAVGNAYTTFTFQVRDNGGTANAGVDLDQSPNTITVNVTSVNDAPSGTNATLTAVEDTARAFTAADFGFTDVADTPANALQSVIITTLPTNGTIRFNGTAITAGQEFTVAQLAQLTFTAAPDANGNNYATFTFQVRDNGGTANGGVDLDPTPKTITFNVTPVNDAPVLAVGATLNYTENQPAQPIDTGLTVSDVDNTSLTGATVSIGAGFVSAEDVLGFTNQNGITGSYNAATGVLTLTGTATVAQYQTALRSVTYANTSENPSTAPRTVNYQVNDGQGANNLSNVQASTVNVTAVNDAPTQVVPGAQTTAEDTSRAIAGVSVADADSTTLTTTISVLHGTLSVTAGGGVTLTNNGTATVTLQGTAAQINAALAGLTYTNTADYNGADTLSVVTNDGALGSGTNSVAITVTPVADIANDTVTTAEDTLVNINVNANDSFENAGHTITAINGTAIAVNGTVAVANGSVTLRANGTLDFTPALNYNNATPTTFTYTVTSGGVTETATVSVNVTPVNDAPVANPDVASTAINTPLTNVAVLANDSDVDGDTLTVSSATVPAAQGTVVVNGNGTLTFTPATNFTGTATITYNISDGNGGTASSTLTVNVGSNTPPDSADKTVTAVEDTALTLATGDFAFNDADAGQTLAAVRIDTLPANGTLRLNGVAVTANQVILASDIAAGRLTFQAALNGNGNNYANFTFSVQDSAGAFDTTPNRITLNVTPVNDNPVAVNDTATVAEDTPLTIPRATLLGNDTDVDGDTLTITSVQGAVNGTVTLSGPNVVFTPNANYNGPASFTYTVSDGNGGTATATVNITVTPVNDNPVAANDSATTAINTTLASVNVLANDTDVDGDTLTVTSATVPAAQGSVTINGDGTLRFVPATNFSGPATITYSISDGNGGTATGTLTVTVGANTPPNSANATVTTLEDTTYTFTNANFAFTDADAGQSLAAVRVDTLPANGSLRLNGVAVTAGQVITIANINAGNLRFVPAADANGANYANFTFSVQDSGGAFDTTPNTLTVNVTPVNDNPVAVNDTATVAEDTPLTIPRSTLLGNDTDVDGDTLTITSVQGAVNGTVTLSGANVVFTPNANYNGPASFTYTVSDGNGGTATATVNITVTPVNDNPVANNDTATTPINTTLGSINVLGNDTDVDGDALSVTSATVPAAQGSVTINGDGTLRFVPATNFSGPATITYAISDGNGGTATGTLTVTVGANTPPNSANATVTTLEDTTLTLTNANFAFTDADAGQTLAAVRIDTLPANGSLRLNGVAVTAGQVISIANINAGNLRFVPVADANGTNYANFTFSVQDSGGAFDATPNTITVNVTPVNDNPVAVNDTATTAEDTPLTIARATLLGNDTDVDGDTLTITSVQGAVNGTVALSGANVIFTPNANYNGPASFTYTVSDGNGGTATATVNITVTAVNDNPVANNDNATTAINTTLASINVLGNDTDVDGDTLSVTSATVPAAQGTVTINGDGTLRFVPANNFSGPATITYAISDGNGGTASATVTVNVGANTPPDSANATVTTLEDTTYTFTNGNFAFTDADAGQTLAAVRVDTLPANGSLRLNGVAVTAGQVVSIANINAGNLRFVPALNGNGANYANFTFSVQDSGGAFDATPNTLTVNVTPVNDNPVAVNDTATTAEDTPLTISQATLLGNDTDVDGDTLSITSVQGAVNGTVSISGANVIFTPNANYNGPASFTYTVSDGNGGTATATVNITVTAVNDNPVANADSAATPINTTLTSINVLANDTDVDGDALTVTSATVPAAQGAVTINGDGTLRFVPATNFSGPATITYAISDGNGGTATGTLTVTVGANTPPNSANATVTTLEDTTVTLTNANFAFTDADAGQTLAAVRIDALPANGVLRLNGVAVTAGQVVSISDINAGNLRFVPVANANGANYANFTFSVQDSGGAFDATPNTLTINVTPVNDNPVAVNDTATTAEDTPLTLTPATLLGNDSDVDGDTLTITSVQGAVNGTVTLTGGNVVFTPNANYNGPASFTYTVSDGNGGTATATVNLTVTAVNDNPVANPDNVSTPINVPATNINVLGNDTDVDGDTLTVTSATVPAAQGTVVVNGNGTLTFTPASNSTGPATITYTISDGNGGSATGTVTVNVGANTPPTSTNATVTTLEDTTLTLNNANFAFNDADANQTLAAVRIDTLPANGSLRLNGVAVTAGQVISIANINAGNLRFVPVANANGVNYANFTFSVQDSGGAFDATPNTITVNVTPVNDNPVAVNDTATVAEDTPLTIAQSTLLGNDTDIDGDTLTIQSVQGAVNGTVSIVGANVVFTPNANYNGPASFTYTVADGNGGTSTATVNITVTAVNDNPVANTDSATTAINTTLNSINVLGNDTDVDGDTLSVTSASVPAAQGSVTVNGDGTLRFVPALNFSGTATITYNIADGNGGTASSTVSVFVGANTPPNSANATVTTAEDTTVSLTATYFAFTDADAGQTLAGVRIDTLPANGVLRLNGVAVTAGQVVSVANINAGNLTFRPTLNGNGANYTTFNFSVQDSGGAFDATPNTITVNVTPVNDNPVAANDTVTTAEDTPLTITPATLLGNDSDVDGDTLTILSVQGAVNGTVALTGGNVVFTPNANFNGVANFSYTVSDGNGGTATALVTVNVTAVNDNPVAVNDAATTAEDTPLTINPATLLGNDTDVDGDTLTITSVQGAVNGTVTLTGGNVVFTPNANYNGPASFTYTVSDGNGGTATATVNVTVTAVNDNPVANADSATTPVNTPTVPLNVLANDTDVDGDTLTVTSASVAPARGTVVVNADNTLTFTPATNVSGPAVITYTISDGNGGTATSTLTVNVGANTPPNSANTTVTTLEDTTYTFTNGNFAFTDADAGQTLAGVRIDTLPANGSLRLNGVAVTAGQIVNTADITAGNLRFVPVANANGANYANFTFSVQDSGGAFDTTPNTATINVTPVNDAPVANNDTVTTAEDTPLTLTPATLLGNDTDVDGDTLTIQSVQGAVNGTVALTGGNVVFTPNANYNGPASFTYTVRDPSGATSTATVSVNVTAVNDNPVAVNDNATTPVNTPLANINVLGNDTDVDGDTITLTSATVPAAQGTVTINGNGTINFTPATNFSGTATVTYTIADGNGGTATGTLSVNVGANTPPNGASITGTFSEDTPVVLGDGAFYFYDPDAGQTLAAVRIDTLPGRGVLSLNGVPVVAGQVISAADLSANRLVYTPGANESGTPYTQFTYSVQDSAGAFDTTPDVYGFNVLPVNDNPVLGNSNTLTYTENQAPQAIDPGLTVGDIDNTTLVGATVTIGAGFAAGQDVLGFTNQNGITGSYNAATGVLTLTGTATLAQYETALRSVTYSNTSENPSTAARTVAFQVNDGEVINNGSNVQNSTVNVISVNDAPVANPDNAATAINAPLANINVLGNDTDAEGDTLTVTSATVSAAQGTVTVNGNGTLNFTPATNFSGAATVTYVISDGNGGSATGTLIVNVGTNTPPNSADRTVTATEDTAFTLGTGDFAFTDPDAGQTLAGVRVDTLPTNGTLRLNGVAVTAGQVVSAANIAAGNLTFVPGLNGNGANYANFTFSVQDSGGAFDTTPNTLTFNVTAVNDTPSATADTVTATEDTPLTITPATLLGNDTDVDGDALTIQSVQGAVNGTVTLTGGNVVFTPNANFNGVASFTYTVRDPSGATSTATVTVNVAAVNDTPVANPDVASTAINATLTNINVLANDTDVDGDTLSVTSATVPAAQGTVTVNGNGTLNFTPALNFTGPATVTYTVSDGNGGTTTGTLTVNVGTNTPPNSADATLTATEDTALVLTTGNFVFTDADAGQSLANVRIDTVPANGSLSLNGVAVTAGQIVSAADIAAGNLTFLPALNGNGANYANFTFSVQDSGGAFDTTPNRITLNVTAVNDTPVANPDTVVAVEDTPLTLTPASLLGNDTDADGDTLTIASVQGAVNGTVALVGGNVVFTPNANYNGPASFTYTVRDPSGATSTATVTINVTAVNDNPIASNDVASTAINAPLANINVLGNDTDVEGDTLSVTSATVNAAQGVVTVNANGTLNFTPATNFTGPATITYAISDGNGGTATGTLTVNVGTNTPPTSANATVAGTEDTPLTLTTGNFAFNDADAGQTLANVRIDSIPANGALQLNGVPVAVGQVVSAADIAAGRLVFVPGANGNGVNYASFSFSVQDSAGAFSATPSAITLDVTAVNDTPVANPDTVTTPEDAPLTLTPAALLGNDIDVDGEALTIVSVQGAVGGTVAIVGGNVVFTPTPNFNGTASFTYTVRDPSGATSTATVGVNVTPVDDPITADIQHDAANDTGSTPNDGITSNNSPAITGTSTPGDTITLYAPDGVTVIGTTVVDAQGNWSIDPAGPYLTEGVNNLSVRATDPNGNQSAATPVQVVLDTTPTAAPNVRITEDTNGDGIISPTEAVGPVNVDVVLPGDAKVGDVVRITDGTLVNIIVVSAADIAAGKVTSAFPNPGEGVVITVSATITDIAGNVSVSGSASATMYTTPLLANPDSVTASPRDPLVLDPAALLSNDTASPGSTLTVVSVQDGVNGTVALVNGLIVFTPAPGFFGNASFTYTVSDGKGHTATSSVSVTVLSEDVRVPESRPVDDVPVKPVPWTPAIDHAIFVEHSVDASRAEAGLRSGQGVFVTDGATFAELASEQATRQDSLTPAVQDSLFVQHAVRHESLNTDPSLFVQTSVRASQLESLARNVRIDSVNSATPGVSTLLDPFAIGSLSGMDAAKTAGDASDNATDRTQAEKDVAEKALAAKAAALAAKAQQDAAKTDAPVPAAPVKRVAAAGFASQLRQNASSLRHTTLRPETRPEARTTAVPPAKGGK